MLQKPPPGGTCGPTRLPRTREPTPTTRAPVPPGTNLSSSTPWPAPPPAIQCAASGVHRQAKRYRRRLARSVPRRLTDARLGQPVHEHSSANHIPPTE
jgi:hypothetical protein